MKKKELVFKLSKSDMNSVSEESGHTKRQNSISAANWPNTGLVDNLIDYLSCHLSELTGERNDPLLEFEKAVGAVLSRCQEPELHRILKEQGWTGAHFQLGLDPPFIDAQSCLNALSNYYLKVNAQPNISEVNSSETIESHQLDQILPFCPDILVTYLKKQAFNSFGSEPRRLTFKGACMLADISGFSKFSGAMCSKGVSGLDDLREATNGFLGYFVKQVYEYEGDVIEFAGDALICAFRNTSEGMSEACFRALQCAHVLRQHKTAFLSTHIGVTCGEMQIGLLGGHNDQWVYVMNGECVSQLAGCIEDAGSQEVAITEECYYYARTHDTYPGTPVAFRNKLQVEKERKPSGNFLLKSIAVKRTSTPPPPLSPFSSANGPASLGLIRSPSNSVLGTASSDTEGAHSHHPAGNHASAWLHMKKSFQSVHDVAAEVLLKQKSEHLIEDGARRAAILALARSSSDLTDCYDPVTAENTTTNAHLLADANKGVGAPLTPVLVPEIVPVTPVGVAAAKILGRKKSSAIMETYISPVSSHSAANTLAHDDCGSISTAQSSLLLSNTSISPKSGARRAMLTPTFKSKMSFTLGSPALGEAKGTVSDSPGMKAVASFTLGSSSAKDRAEPSLLHTKSSSFTLGSPAGRQANGNVSTEDVLELMSPMVPSTAATITVCDNTMTTPTTASAAPGTGVASTASRNSKGRNLPPLPTPTPEHGSIPPRMPSQNYNNSIPTPNNHEDGIAAAVDSMRNETHTRNRADSNTSDGVGVTLQLPSALKRAGSGAARGAGAGLQFRNMLKDLQNENTTIEQNNSNNHNNNSNYNNDNAANPAVTLAAIAASSPLSVFDLTKNHSLRSVNFSRNTSFSDISDVSRGNTPSSGAMNPNSLEAALKIIRSGDQPPQAAVGGPGGPDRADSNSKFRFDTFSPQNSIEISKKRFTSWGLMKNALRRESFREKYKTTEAEFIQTVSRFVPRPVLNAVHSECLDLIGELRQVTTMFVALDSYSSTLNKDPCTLQPFFLMAQTALHEAGGFLRQFLVDDKGCVFIAMWGVPSFTYSNNCSRALYCSAKIIEGTASLGQRCSIGIATGTVFCGSVGALERRDYVGVGTDVNIAARLMGKAHGRILIDPATYRSLNSETQTLLTAAEEMNLKGLAGPTVPYQYVSKELPRMTDIDVEAAQLSVLRPKMQSALSKLLDAFMNVSSDTTVEILEKKLTVTFIFLFGLPGTGKSLAAQFYRNAARKRNINCLHLTAKADSQGVPYGLLRELFLELIGRTNFVTFEQKMNVVTKIIDEICDETDPEDERTCALESLQLVLGMEPQEIEGIRDSILNRPSTSNEFDKSNSTTVSGDYFPGDSSKINSAESITEMGASSLGDSGSSAKNGTADDSIRQLRSRSSVLMIKQCSNQSRKFDDYTFYNVIAHLLRNSPTVLIIENAHFIDELSWKELFLMQAGDQLEMSVLLTMEVAHIPEGRYKMADEDAVAATKQRTMSVMNTSFTGDYWDAKEGQEALEVSEAQDTNIDDFIPNSTFENLNSAPRRGSIFNSAGSGLFRNNSQSNDNSVNSSLTPVHNRSNSKLTSNISQNSMNDEDTMRMSIRGNPIEFWCSILDNPTSTVLVIGELSREEVLQEMSRSIDLPALTDGLVDLVYNITSGNAYWVKAMTQFIRERGAEALFKAVSDRRSRQNPLKQLVLVHFETHIPEFQVLSKHASIIGVEFDEEILRAIVPPKLKVTLSASLDKLVEKRFLQCLDPQDRTFCFPNQLIQTTIYELTPPSDAAHLHLLIAQYIEKTYPHDIRSHYPTLGYHYKRCPDKRALAFKYELKSADQQVGKGAFSDGLVFLKSAIKLAERDVELDVVLEVIARAVEDIKENTGMLAPPPTSTLQRLQSFYTGTNNSRTNGFVLRYSALRKFVLSKKELLRKESEKLIASEKSVEKKKELLKKARAEKKQGTLTWQPSYVAGKRDSSANSTPTASSGNPHKSSDNGEISSGTDKKNKKITKSSNGSNRSSSDVADLDYTEPSTSTATGCSCAIS